MTPATFLQFAADRTTLLLALFERADVDEAELLALINKHRTDADPATDHLRRQLEEYGIIERSPIAETSFELTLPLRELFSWLTHKQRLSSATVLRGYLDDLKAEAKDLETAINGSDANMAMLSLKGIDGTIDRLRSLSMANRESTISESQALRSAGYGISSVVRFQTVRRLWERFLEPLRQLVDVKGEMEQRFESLRAVLDDGERHFITHGAVYRAFARTIARVTRLRRTALEDQRSSVQEVAPLYERMRRENLWVRGASSALQRIRKEGISSLGIDNRLGILSWRTQFLMSDEKLRARISGLVGYCPSGRAVIGDAPPPPPASFIPQAELRAKLKAALPVDDVLAFVLSSWPDLPLGPQLRAYGQVVSGEFGPIEAGEPKAEKTYAYKSGRIRAWPLKLMRVVP